MGTPIHMMSRWQLDMMRDAACGYLEKFDDKSDRSNFRSHYLKMWMLKEYDCRTLAELRSWVRHG